jgi:hypothetical protein
MGKGTLNRLAPPLPARVVNLACAISRPPHQPAKCGPRTSRLYNDYTLQSPHEAQFPKRCLLQHEN